MPLLIIPAILTLAKTAPAQQFSVSPSSVNVDAQGVTGSQVQVTADSSLAWTASSNQTWLTITAGNSGQGNGTIQFTVGPTITAASRTATITVSSSQGTVPVPVTQTAGNLVVSPSSGNVPAAGGSGTETVTSNSTAMPWTVTSDQQWLTISGSSSRTGSDMVQWTAAANSTSSARSGNIIISPADGSAQTVPINQEAGPVGSTDLTLSKTHSGTFEQGGSGTFSIAVSNPGSAPSNGAVTVSDVIPAGLTATAATGDGWTCTVGATATCTRSNALAAGASYPAITLTVNVAGNAPASITNTASVSGGGDTNPANNSGSDTVNIIATVPPDLSINKSHTGSFNVGQSGNFTINVFNEATAGPTSGTVTVSDTLPVGLTATTATGDGWTCTLGATVTCTRGDVLAAGVRYPAITLTVKIAGNAPALVTNTAMVSGGGDVTPANNIAFDQVNISRVIPSDLSISKTHTGNFTTGQTGAFTITISNAAAAGPTSGTVTVSDTLPIGLTGTAVTGTGWTCTEVATVTCARSDALAAGASYPPITVTVAVATNAPSSVTNTATVSGGGDTNVSNNSASDTVVISTVPPKLSITKSHTGPFTAGQTGVYTIIVSNAQAGPTSGAVTVSDLLPDPLIATAATGAGWTCTINPTVSCTRSDTLAAGASYPAISLGVNVAPSAPAGVVNVATVVGGVGGGLGGVLQVAADPTAIISAADLSIAKSHTGNFTAGQSGEFAIVVSNSISAGASTGIVTVSDALPTGLTATAASGSGWACATGATVTCTRGDALAAGASYPAIALTVNVAANAPASVTNTASVSGGGDLTPANNSASDTVAIGAMPPDLSIAKSHTGNFTPGKSGAYTIAVSNAAAAGPTAGAVTVSDTLPTGLTATAASGSGWACTIGATVTCTRTDALAAGASYPPISLAVNVAANAPMSVTNMATVGGGGDVTPANNSASDPTSINTVAPDLSLVKVHSGGFIPGQTGAYTLSVSNAATTGPSSGAVSVSDTMPTGLTATAATGSGWSCTVGSTVTCTRSDALAPGNSYPPITVSVNVASNAPPSVTNTATVSGGGDVTPGNNAASDTTSIPAAPPDLSITKSHTGSFTAGKTGSYTIMVSNAAGSGPTSGPVTVADTLPGGLTATAAAGDGWGCTVGATVNCTRGDTLSPGASFPAITLTTNVAASAPGSITNTATVTGGGDNTPDNNSASDPTSITGSGSDLSITKVHSGSFLPGQSGTYVLLVANAANAGPTSAAVTVTDPLPVGLIATAVTGTGWTCNVGATVSCTRSDVLTAGNTYPPITLNVNVAATAPATITNTATVSGGGDTNLSNNTGTDTVTTPAQPSDLSITKSHAGTFVAGQTGSYSILVSNAPSAGPTSGVVTVTDAIPSGLTATAAIGDGWSCTIGLTVSCTRSDVLSPGAGYSPIVISVAVSSGAPPTIVNTATVAGGGDGFPGNNSASDSTSIGAAPDLSITKSRTTDLIPGQTGSYTIVVSNSAAAGPTTGIVTVSDTIPPGLTPVSAAGTGWACTTGATVVCTRSDVLAPGTSYPPVTLTVNIASDAAETIINSATVSGGGDASPGNNTASDSGSPVTNSCLSITASTSAHLADNTGQVTIVVSNAGVVVSSGETLVLGSPPFFAPPISASGDGWTCGILSLAVSCTRTDSLAPGAQFPPITVIADLSNAAPGSAGNATFYVGNSACVVPATESVQLPQVIPFAPEISLVTNSASFVTPGQPNYGIAPGSLITIFGNSIGPITPAQVTSLPLDPTGFAGVSVTATVGNTTLAVPLMFASATQLNVLLPSGMPPGDGTLVVTFNGQTTAPFPIRVVNTALGIFTPNRQGYGPGVAQIALTGDAVVQNSLVTSAAPGQIVELWATGLGPVQGDEFAMPLPGNLDVPVDIYIGGQKVQPTYAGRSGCCVGTDQIHLIVPATVQGCYVPVFVTAGGVVSNTVTLSISGSDLCADPGGLTPSELARLNIGQALVGGTISLNRSISPDQTKQDFALETYRNLNLFSTLISEPDYPAPPVGSCTVGQSRRDGQGMAPAAPLYVPTDALSVFPPREKPNAYMAAGSPQITATSQTETLKPDTFLRYSSLIGPSSTFFDPGLVTASNEQTDAPLGLLPQSVTLPAAPQVIGWSQPGSTNPSIIDRTAPLTVQWSGGDPANDLGLIAGFKTITSLSGGRQGTTATSWFVCTAPITAGTYTVPAEVLQAMPAGLPITGPSGQQLPWLPGGSLNEITAQKSSLSIGSIRMPMASRFQTLGVEFGRLLYQLVMKLPVDYR